MDARVTADIRYLVIYVRPDGALIAQDPITIGLVLSLIQIGRVETGNAQLVQKFLIGSCSRIIGNLKPSIVAAEHREYPRRGIEQV